MLFVVSRMLPATDYLTRMDMFVVCGLINMVVIAGWSSVVHYLSISVDHEWASVLDWIMLGTIIAVYLVQNCLVFAPAIIRFRTARNALLSYDWDMWNGEPKQPSPGSEEDLHEVGEGAEFISTAKILHKPGTYLLVTATLDESHDMYLRMPPTADAFVDALKSTNPPCFVDKGRRTRCIDAQTELLPALIEAFNNAGSAQKRFDLANKFMVEAADAEKASGDKLTVRRYELQPSASPETVFFLEDYPAGDEAHGKTLAVGVFRWMRFVAKLTDAKVVRYTSAQERDDALKAVQALQAVQVPVEHEDTKPMPKVRKASFSSKSSSYNPHMC